MSNLQDYMHSLPSKTVNVSADTSADEYNAEVEKKLIRYLEAQDFYLDDRTIGAKIHSYSFSTQGNITGDEDWDELQDNLYKKFDGLYIDYSYGSDDYDNIDYSKQNETMSITFV